MADMVKMKSRVLFLGLVLIILPLFVIFTTKTDLDKVSSTHVSLSSQRDRARPSTYNTDTADACSSVHGWSGDCQMIDLCIVAAGSEAVISLTTVIKSVMYYSTSPVHLHLITDDISYPILHKLFNTWAIPGVVYSLYNTSSIEPKVSWVENLHYSGIFGLMKLEVPNLLPASVNKVLLLDTDVVLAADITSLWREFCRFANSQYIGLVENLSVWYLPEYGITRWPAKGRGYNTGVTLMDLEKIRKLKWSETWTDVARRSVAKYGPTKLADQDIINVMILENPLLIHDLDCRWNVQLSERADLTSFCYNQQNTGAVHFNSPDKLHVSYSEMKQNIALEYFKDIYMTFNQLDGSLLKVKPSGSVSTSCMERRGGQEVPPVATQAIPILGWNSEVIEACYLVEGVGRSGRGRIHPFYTRYNSTSISPRDITLVTQLDVQRLATLELVAEAWPGPISVALYLTDSDAILFHDFLSNSETLSSRRNIGYHVLFKTGVHYPVNKLRNIALEYSPTDLIFLADIDFIPGAVVYQALMRHAGNLKPAENKLALVVPAFETQLHNLLLPSDKSQLKNLTNNNQIQPFRLDIWASGHGPTNYTRWYESSQPYHVVWQPNYEPYIVVSKRLAPRYDERFFGFGWNKVSHIMEIDAVGLKLMVLPDVFTVHIPHTASLDYGKFKHSPKYRRCMKVLKQEFQKDLSRKYGISALKYLSND